MSSWLQRVSREAGRIGNQAYDKTFGELGGWAGKHLFGDNTALGDYTRHLMTMSAGGAIPFGGAITGEMADYAGQRQRGASEGKAWGGLGRHFGESLAAMIGGELGATYGGDIPGNLGYADWGSMGNSLMDSLGTGSGGMGGSNNQMLGNALKMMGGGQQQQPEQHRMDAIPMGQAVVGSMNVTPPQNNALTQQLLAALLSRNNSNG